MDVIVSARHMTKFPSSMKLEAEGSVREDVFKISKTDEGGGSL